MLKYWLGWYILLKYLEVDTKVSACGDDADPMGNQDSKNCCAASSCGCAC